MTNHEEAFLQSVHDDPRRCRAPAGLCRLARRPRRGLHPLAGPAGGAGLTLRNCQFTAEATAYVANPVFLAKMALLALALVNTAWFHMGPYRRRRAVGPTMGIPPAMRLSAGLSALGWAAVLICGRLIAYV